MMTWICKGRAFECSCGARRVGCDFGLPAAVLVVTVSGVVGVVWRMHVVCECGCGCGCVDVLCFPRSHRGPAVKQHETTPSHKQGVLPAGRSEIETDTRMSHAAAAAVIRII